MNRIREYRRKNGLTAAELGELIGLSQSTISKIENEQTSPKVEWLEKMAERVGLIEMTNEKIVFLDVQKQFSKRSE